MLYFKLANIIHMHILTDSYHTLQSKSNFVCNGNHVICREISHMDEAAKVARTKMFGLWVTLGPPSLFFTISPISRNRPFLELLMAPRVQ